MAKILSIQVTVVIVSLVLATPVAAQQNALFEDEVELLEELDDENKNELVVAPIPVINPTIGAGLAVAAIYFYQLDEGSQPSFTAVGGVFTDSKSWGYGVVQTAYFKDDAWKLTAGAGTFDLNLRFYGVGRLGGDRGLSIPLNQDGWGAGIRGLRRIKGHWYGGLQYYFARVTSTFDRSGIDGPIDLPPLIELDSQIAGLGLMVEYDSRDNRFNSTEGSLFDVTWSNSNESFGSDFDFSSTKIEYNIYRKIAEQKVIAGRATTCATPGDAPFYALCKFGQGVDLRGYVGGRFRDERMATVQAEFRWRFYKRWGLVAFAGFGEVGESWSDFNFDDVLPSAGVGLRFKISKTTGLNLSVDYAVGKDSDAWYFYVGESF